MTGSIDVLIFVVFIRFIFVPYGRPQWTGGRLHLTLMRPKGCAVVNNSRQCRPAGQKMRGMPD